LEAIKPVESPKRTVNISPNTDLNNLDIAIPTVKKSKVKISEPSPFQILQDVFEEARISKNSVTRFYEKDGEQLNEENLVSLYIDLQEQYNKVKGFTKQNFDLFLKSDKIRIVNPLKDYLHHLPTNSSPNLVEKLVASLRLRPKDEFDKAAATCFVNPTVDFSTHLIKKWLVGMIAGIFEGNYNSLMLVLIGEKNTGKTEFFRRLLPSSLRNYYAQSKFNEGKDSEALMCEKLLILNDELDGMNKKDAKTFRNFISQDKYTFRPPYGSSNITAKRLASVGGTSNDRDIINDPENNRRIIPIEIISIDYQLYNSIDKDELFADVYTHYKNGFDWNFTKDDVKWFDLFAQGFETYSIERELIRSNYMPGDASEAENLTLSATEIFKELAELNTVARLNPNKIGKELSALGFKQRSVRRNGQSLKLYDCIKLNRSW
jgi:hypothetical protein